MGSPRLVETRGATSAVRHMHPILFSIGPFTIYTYGVLLAAAYLLGLKLAMIRARSRYLDSTRVLDLGVWIIISALVGAKLMLLVVDFQYFGQILPSLSRSRDRAGFYGVDPGRHRFHLVYPSSGPAALDDV